MSKPAFKDGTPRQAGKRKSRGSHKRRPEADSLEKSSNACISAAEKIACSPGVSAVVTNSPLETGGPYTQISSPTLGYPERTVSTLNEQANVTLESPVDATPQGNTIPVDADITYYADWPEGWEEIDSQMLEQYENGTQVALHHIIEDSKANPDFTNSQRQSGVSNCPPDEDGLNLPGGHAHTDQLHFSSFDGEGNVARQHYYRPEGKSGLKRRNSEANSLNRSHSISSESEYAGEETWFSVASSPDQGETFSPRGSGYKMSPSKNEDVRHSMEKEGVQEEDILTGDALLILEKYVTELVEKSGIYNNSVNPTTREQKRKAVSERFNGECIQEVTRGGERREEGENEDEEGNFSEGESGTSGYDGSVMEASYTNFRGALTSRLCAPNDKLLLNSARKRKSKPRDAGKSTKVGASWSLKDPSPGFSGEEFRGIIPSANLATASYDTEAQEVSQAASYRGLPRIIVQGEDWPLSGWSYHWSVLTAPCAYVILASTRIAGSVSSAFLYLMDSLGRSYEVERILKKSLHCDM